MASAEDYSPHEPMGWGAEPDVPSEALVSRSGPMAEGFDLEETLLNNVVHNPRIEKMIQAALAGALPLGRPLESYEPDKLNSRHISVIMLRAVGYLQNRIAELTGYSVGAVSVILRHPYSRMILSAILAEGAKQSIDISGQVRREAPKMLKIVSDIANDPEVKPETRTRAAFGWLGMYERLEEKQSTSDPSALQMDKDESSRLIEAIRESREIVEVPYLLVNKAVPNVSQVDRGQLGTAPDLLPGDNLDEAALARQRQLESVLEARISTLEALQGRADGSELGTPTEPSPLSDISRSSVPGRSPSYRTIDESDDSVPNSFLSPPSAVGVRIERQGATSDGEQVA